MDSNRRSSRRHEVGLPATLVVDAGSEACTIANLSLGGALVETTTRMPIGARVTLKFAVLNETVDVTAIVRWQTARELGLQFDGLRARESWALGRFLKDSVVSRAS